MPSPRVFISSTYVDLVDARSVLESYFRELLYECVVFERGGIHFDPRKPLDVSCYDAVKDCDLMILIIGSRYGSPSSDPSISSDGLRYNSVTKGEYLEALSAGIPIITFIKQSVYGEFFTFINQPKHQRRAFNALTVDNPLIFQLINEIRELKTNNLVIEYENVTEIVSYLKRSTASLVHDALKTKKLTKDSSLKPINGYKLFYYRRRKGFSHTQLSKAAKLSRNFLTSLENVLNPSAAEKHGHIFRSCDSKVIIQLEELLDCRGHLNCGREDDLLAMYIQYYHCNRGKQGGNAAPSQRGIQQLFPVKCVVFDFDGTLTKANDRTTWEFIWEELGYTVEDCAKLHRAFTNKEFDHSMWCVKTCEAFNARGISEQTLVDVAKKIELMPGVPELLTILQDNQIEMHILSGSIEQIINVILGDLGHKFTHIQANSFKFTGKFLSYIKGTDYDFEGKAKYVSELLKRNKLSPTDVLFVGNSSNDRWVSRSGITTLCVNPHFTDGNDEREWLDCIREMHDVREILKFIRLPAQLVI